MAVDEITHLRAALELIGPDCRAYVPSARTCLDSGKSPYARWGADKWCHGCIARTALSGEPFPPRGTSGVEETP